MRLLVEDLGILSIAFAFCTFVVRYTELRWSKKSHADAVSESMVFFRDNVRTPLLTCAGLFFVLGFSIGPYEIHQQDTVKIGDRDSLAKESQNLRDKLEDARNNLSVSSPAANNLMYLLQAFRGYRGALGGFKTIACHVRLTAPPDSNSIAMTVSAFSIQVTNCGTFGPMDANNSPDEERDTITGMIPGAIVFHARQDDKAAFSLFDSLSNLLPMKRSYEVPGGSPDNFIWLQFGSGVKWNSQRLMQHGAH